MIVALGGLSSVFVFFHPHFTPQEISTWRVVFFLNIQVT